MSCLVNDAVILTRYTGELESYLCGPVQQGIGSYISRTGKKFTALLVVGTNCLLINFVGDNSS